MTQDAIVAARSISRSFFSNRVLNDVSITLRAGTIHALLGENGAGKSTLIGILSGALAPDAGDIDIDGVRHAAVRPAIARAAGIAVVQQELSLTSQLSIAENVGMGALPRRLGLIDYSALMRRAHEVCALVGLEQDLARPVGDLPLGQQQLVEIAKALFRKPRVLILDEPTSSLSAHEAANLMAVLRRLRDAGTAVLYISHRLNEVLALCEWVTVLKDGVVTADRSLGGVDAQGLVRLMVGREPGDLFPRWTPSAEPAPIIAVEGLSAGMVRDVAMTIRRGEVLGVGGLVGQGQEDLLLGLYGAIPAVAGRAEFNGVVGLPRSVPQANARGLAYVPADRKREGLHLIHSIAWNLMIPSFGRAPSLAMRRTASERERAIALADRLGIKGDLTREVQALSGGNQQKVALAKWLPSDPPVLLLNDPTRGVDVDTKREIYALLRRFAAEGRAVVLLSSDTPELVNLCDRVAVMRAGRLVRVLERTELSEEAIVSAAMESAVPGAAA
ncbi:sugar ABC transporter ATP-binding protein [Bradyrhizobium iriomotense]|uniref:Ribose/galactose/methyl galactoside import ATP-binding protein 3 n=1 Tax=Bradyrhizobium iriomotense TaxID=441950 RepID=A0ABQ6BG72_9BRAD|nr:sugar ABC transporter ATP-binding protein [Bradyrhizobium iriomotense]GLR91163.1 putative ribose/galactose/methyl galactoside import ATP-binding protein 3 [Bradyrhizobium iriomotense]